MQNISNKRLNSYALLLGIFLTLFLGVCFELALGFFWKDELKTKTHHETGYFYRDEWGITKAVAGKNYRSFSTDVKTGNKIYDVIYAIDGLSRRVTPTDEAFPRQKFLMLFGCSFMFGEGLNGNQTLPYYLAAGAREYKPYNYAFHGHSPAEMLAKMQSGTLPEEVKEKTGTLIYLFMDAHVKRAIGSMQVVSTWGSNRPYYFLGPDEKPVRKSDFAEGRPWRTLFYTWIYKSCLVRFFKIDLPVIVDKDIRFTARLIEESHRLYKEQFPQGEFYTVIYPGSKYGKKLTRILSRKGIRCLDYSAAFRTDDPKYVLSPLDLHPSALADQTVSKMVLKDAFTEAPAPQALSASGVPVLMYHDIVSGDPGKPGNEVIALDQFEWQMKFLKDNGYHALSIEELVRVLRGKQRAPDKSVVITIDDGFKSAVQAAAILKKYGHKASFWIISGEKGIGGPYMDWKDIENLDRDPLFEIGAHSLSHSCDMASWPEKDVRFELEESKRILEKRLGHPVRYFAWPCGNYNQKNIQLAREAGYEALLTAWNGLNGPGQDLMQIHRTIVSGANGLEIFKAQLEDGLHRS